MASPNDDLHVPPLRVGPATGTDPPDQTHRSKMGSLRHLHAIGGRPGVRGPFGHQRLPPPRPRPPSIQPPPASAPPRRGSPPLSSRHPRAKQAHQGQPVALHSLRHGRSRVSAAPPTGLGPERFDPTEVQAPLVRRSWCPRLGPAVGHDRVRATGTQPGSREPEREPHAGDDHRRGPEPWRQRATGRAGVPALDVRALCG